jgi:acetyltransferase
VVVLKAGRKPAGQQGRADPLGRIVGSDDVFDAACAAPGAVRVRCSWQLFSAAKCLASRYRPVGKRLAIVTNGGGPGVLAADWASEIGLELASSVTGPRRGAGRSWAAGLAGDVIDLAKTPRPTSTARRWRPASKDRRSTACSSSTRPRPAATPRHRGRARGFRPHRASRCWPAGWATPRWAKRARCSTTAMIPSFRTPEAAVDAFGNIASFYQNQQLLQQTPPPLSTWPSPTSKAPGC